MSKKRYVPEGAILVCNKGSQKKTLKVTHNNNVSLYKVPYANEEDKNFEENIPCFNKCSICGDCKLDPLNWKPVHESVKIGGSRLIYEDSKLGCKHGGEISIFLNEKEANEALKNNDYNKQSEWEKIKGVNWERVGKVFVGAFVNGAINSFKFAVGAVIVGAAVSILAASCAPLAAAITIVKVGIAIYSTYQLIRGVYETYKAIEESGDIEEGLVILAGAVGDAAGSYVGAMVGGKVGEALADGLFSGSKTYQEIKNGELCFMAGTLIASKYGKRRIESLSYGDEVYCYNEKEDERILKKVLKIYKHRTKSMIKIKTENEEIMTTYEHPFYVNGKYILAGFLSAGMSLTGFAGEKIKILGIENISYSQEQKVYNFQVEGFENYYVGEQGILVHNNGGCPKGNGEKIVSTNELESEIKIIEEGKLSTGKEYVYMEKIEGKIINSNELLTLEGQAKVNNMSIDEFSSLMKSEGANVLGPFDTNGTGIGQKIEVEGHTLINSIRTNNNGSHGASYTVIGTTKLGKIKVINGNPLNYSTRGNNIEKAILIFLK
jgi:hedgehog/intein hint domain protein